MLHKPVFDKKFLGFALPNESVGKLADDAYFSLAFLISRVAGFWLGHKETKHAFDPLTREYLESGEMPDGECSIVEECHDADEARWLAERYEAIIGKIREQINSQW